LLGLLLRPAPYLSKKLTRPTPTKDGGTLRTIHDACDYMIGMGKTRELRQHWQRACKLILAHADVFAVSRALELALFMDAKLDVSKGWKSSVTLHWEQPGPDADRHKETGALGDDRGQPLHPRIGRYVDASSAVRRGSAWQHCGIRLLHVERISDDEGPQ
jgi:hypothetical protein